MKRLFTLTAFMLAIVFSAVAEWKIAGDKIRSTWAEQVDPSATLAEYPRPQMVRSEWMNLNGLWNYAITPSYSAKPSKFDGEILVPFAIESALSGVQRRVDKDNALWYERDVVIPASWASKRVMLNFGAVDWRAEVYVNDVAVGYHTGGYAPFSVDITAALSKSGKQRIAVRVWDPTDESENPVGKQRIRTYNIWYTSVTGIWQTVWMEPVARKNHITSVLPESSVVKGEMYVTVGCVENTDAKLAIEILDGDKVVAKVLSMAGCKTVIPMADAKLWSPSSPFLYGLRVALLDERGKAMDAVESYAAMREIGTMRDKSGHKRITLNGEPIFMYGPLDQGWWPDGLYTAPTDEALLSDILLAKRLGFNAIRKHIKVEPDRWYYHCDREGIMVWQDMPSGQHIGFDWGRNTMNGGSDQQISTAGKATYYKEWSEIMNTLRFHPSIVIWVPFNEGWSQFDTEYTATWTKQHDPSRLVNAASGGNLRECGDIIDIHNYPRPAMPVRSAERVVVLGEYGGIGYSIDGHLWQEERTWKYANTSDIEQTTQTYVEYANEIVPLIEQGISAAIYTQTTDVEIEANGFVTYDRKVEKMDFDRIREVNEKVIKSLK